MTNPASPNKGRRVAITGLGIVSPLGQSVPGLWEALRAGRSGVVAMPAWGDPSLGIETRVAAPASDFAEQSINRKTRRTMSRIAMLAMVATAHALEDAGLPEADVRSERTGISYGSSMGGTSAIEDYFKANSQTGRLIDGIVSTTFLKVMPHTCAANLAINFGIPGRVIASCVACASGTQAVGYGYEAIRGGLVDRAVCGGAEELTPTVAAIFDVLKATSTKHNDEPALTPRPFDEHRDGIVVGEGAGTFVLEAWDEAVARGAKIYAEVIGFYTNNDATHMTNPSVSGLVRCMQGALADAGLSASDVDYINAHAAGTSAGDRAEALAVAEIFGSSVPISSMKGHLGHLMGAAGALETAACLGMLQDQVLYPTLNLTRASADEGPLDHVVGAPRAARVQTILKNSFAFGGVNASLVIRRVQGRQPS